jgi:hypothetical protein
MNQAEFPNAATVPTMSRLPLTHRPTTRHDAGTIGEFHEAGVELTAREHAAGLSFAFRQSGLDSPDVGRVHCPC